MQSERQRYGKSLPDQVERIASLFDAHLGLLNDVRELYRDRAALEREYATKLQALARRAADKKSKMEALIVVGEDPTKAWDEGSLKHSTLNAAYTQIIDSMINTAQDHNNIAEALTSQVVDVLKGVEKKNEEMKKKEMQFFQKLLADRDRVYNDRVKSKQKYDEECAEVESHRQKQARTQDDRHADRAMKQAENQRNDMLNSKNIYLISTAIANRSKAEFYNEDLPGLEDQFQEFQTRLIRKFTKILLHSQALQMTHLDILKSRLTATESALQNIDPAKDEGLFIEYNIRAFTAPGDWSFEPCSIHYDTEDMSVEAAPKIFLQNKLTRCRTKLQELGPVLEVKRRELDQLTKVVATRDADHSFGSTDEVIDSYLEARQQLVFFTNSECILSAEIDVISAALGDDEGGEQPHSFKSSSFSIPTQCGYCKSSIWGLSKQGKTCKLCGLSVHNKCELKVPADCRRSEGPRHSTISTRKSSVREPAATPTPSSFVQSAVSDESHESYPVSRVLFDFVASSGFELDVHDGEIVQVLEPDDGSGWVKVANSAGSSGLVPATYIELVDTHATPPPPPLTHRPTRQGSGRYVRGIYPYEANGPDELNLAEGELIELTSGSTGGQNYGDGWWEGLDTKGRKGIFPSNYVQLV